MASAVWYLAKAVASALRAGAFWNGLNLLLVDFAVGDETRRNMVFSRPVFGIGCDPLLEIRAVGGRNPLTAR